MLESSCSKLRLLASLLVLWLVVFSVTLQAQNFMTSLSNEDKQAFLKILNSESTMNMAVAQVRFKEYQKEKTRELERNLMIGGGVFIGAGAVSVPLWWFIRSKTVKRLAITGNRSPHYSPNIAELMTLAPKRGGGVELIPMKDINRARQLKKIQKGRGLAQLEHSWSNNPPTIFKSPENSFGLSHKLPEGSSSLSEVGGAGPVNKVFKPVKMGGNFAKDGNPLGLIMGEMMEGEHIVCKRGLGSSCGTASNRASKNRASLKRKISELPASLKQRLVGLRTASQEKLFQAVPTHTKGITPRHALSRARSLPLRSIRGSAITKSAVRALSKIGLTTRALGIFNKATGPAFLLLDMAFLGLDLSQDIPRWQTQDEISRDIMLRSDVMKYLSYVIIWFMIPRMVEDEEAESNDAKTYVNGRLSAMRGRINTLSLQYACPDYPEFQSRLSGGSPENYTLNDHEDSHNYATDCPLGHNRDQYQDINFRLEAVGHIAEEMMDVRQSGKRIEYSDGSVLYSLSVNKPLPLDSTSLTPRQKAYFGYQHNENERQFFLVTKKTNEGEALITSGSGLSILMDSKMQYEKILWEVKADIVAIFKVYIQHIYRSVRMSEHKNACAVCSGEHYPSVLWRYHRPNSSVPYYGNSLEKRARICSACETWKAEVREKSLADQRNEHYLTAIMRHIGNITLGALKDYERLDQSIDLLTEELEGDDDRIDFDDRVQELFATESLAALRREINSQGENAINIIPEENDAESLQHTLLIQNLIKNTVDDYHALQSAMPELVINLLHSTNPSNQYLGQFCANEQNRLYATDTPALLESLVVPNEWSQAKTASNDIISLTDNLKADYLESPEALAVNDDNAWWQHAAQFNELDKGNGKLQNVKSYDAGFIASQLWCHNASSGTEAGQPLRHLSDDSKGRFFVSAYELAGHAPPVIKRSGRNAGTDTLLPLTTPNFSKQGNQFSLTDEHDVYLGPSGKLYQYNGIDENVQVDVVEKFNWRGPRKDKPQLHRFTLNDDSVIRFEPVPSSREWVKGRIDKRKIKLTQAFFRNFRPYIAGRWKPEWQNVAGQPRRKVLTDRDSIEGHELWKSDRTKGSTNTITKVARFTLSSEDVSRHRKMLQSSRPITKKREHLWVSIGHQTIRLRPNEWRYGRRPMKKKQLRLKASLFPGYYRLMNDARSEDFIVTGQGWDSDREIILPDNALAQLTSNKLSLEVHIKLLPKHRLKREWKRFFSQIGDGFPEQADLVEFGVMEYRQSLPGESITNFTASGVLNREQAVAKYQENISHLIDLTFNIGIELTTEQFDYLLASAIGMPTLDDVEGAFNLLVRQLEPSQVVPDSQDSNLRSVADNISPEATTAQYSIVIADIENATTAEQPNGRLRRSVSKGNGDFFSLSSSDFLLDPQVEDSPDLISHWQRVNASIFKRSDRGVVWMDEHDTDSFPDDLEDDTQLVTALKVLNELRGLPLSQLRHFLDRRSVMRPQPFDQTSGSSEAFSRQEAIAPFKQLSVMMTSTRGPGRFFESARLRLIARGENPEAITVGDVLDEIEDNEEFELTQVKLVVSDRSFR